MNVYRESVSHSQNIIGTMPLFGGKKYDPRVTAKYNIKELLGK